VAPCGILASKDIAQIIEFRHDLDFALLVADMDEIDHQHHDQHVEEAIEDGGETHRPDGGIPVALLAVRIAKRMTVKEFKRIVYLPTEVLFFKAI
jgi:hypothetical protein